jgi:hypothetical protein
MASPQRTSSQRDSRLRDSRLRRTLIAALVATTLVAPIAGATSAAAVPAPVPDAMAPLDNSAAVGPVALQVRYTTARTGIGAAERMAADHGDLKRAAELRTMADPARRFLSFDGRDGGRTVEAFGDLSTARRIAVLVPGSDTNLDTYERFRAGAVALQRQLGDEAVVVAWLGYRTPATVSPEVLNTGRADQVAPQLEYFVNGLASAEPDARISVVCHSYGSVVCARAAHALRVSDIVLYGSPGTGVDNVAGLHTGATVWVGRGSHDWIADVPHARLELPFLTIGFGADPVSPEFGARIFAAGDGGHSDYLKPGSVALAGIARIVAGQESTGPASTGTSSTGTSNPGTPSTTSSSSTPGDRHA